MIWWFRHKPSAEEKALENQLWEENYQKLKDDSVGDTSDGSRNYDQYKLFYDSYQKTRDERTDWNKYFLSLLFIQTLIGVLTALLGYKGESPFKGFVPLLLGAIFLVAAGIAFAWFVKLAILRQVILAQRNTLITMEDAVRLPFKGVLREGFGEYELKPLVPLSRFSQHLYRLLSWLNYFFLPLLLFFILLAFGLFLLVSYSALPIS